MTEVDVTDFLASLSERGLAPSSAARTLVAVRGFHRFLALERREPCRGWLGRDVLGQESASSRGIEVIP